MKMTPEDFALLKKGIDNILKDSPNAVEQYETGQFGNSEKVKDLQKRFCWDLFYASGVKIGDGIGIVGDINGDYTNAHIETALRRICPKVTRRY